MLRWIVCFGLIFVCANLATAQEKTLKIVTWNIEYGKNYEEILAGLHTLDADVYLLQEVDLGTRRSGGRNVAEDLARELGYDFLWSQEFQELRQEIGDQPAFTGQAILSRFPLKLVAELRFKHQAAKWTPSIFHPRSWTQPRKGGRVAQFAEIAVGGRKIITVNTHLESSVPDEKLLPQMQEIIGYLAENCGDAPAIIGGDLNTNKIN